MTSPEWERIRAVMAFIDIAREESKRLVLCHPDEADRIRGLLAEHDVMGVLEVGSSSLVDRGKVIVIDEGAMEASFRESLHRSLRDWRTR